MDVEGTLLSKVAISILILSDPLMISLLAMMAVYVNGIASRAASSGHLDVQLPLRCASVFVDLHDRILYPSAVLAVGSFVCSPWMILLSRDLATLVHHLKHLLIIGGIVHRKLIGHLILPPHLLVNESLILLFVICALVPLMVATAAAGPLLRLLSLALLLRSGKLLLLAVALLCGGTSGSHAWLPYHDLDACSLAMVNDSPVIRCRSLRMVTLVRLQIDLLRAVLGSSHDEAAARPGSADGRIGSAEAAEAYGEEQATHAAALPRQVLKNGLCVVPAEMLVRRTGDRAVSRVQRFVR